MIQPPESLLSDLLDGVDENHHYNSPLKRKQPSGLALKTKGEETKLLHKRPYDYGRRVDQALSVMSHETAYFKNQVHKLNFDDDLRFKFYNRSSEEAETHGGLRG